MNDQEKLIEATEYLMALRKQFDEGYFETVFPEINKFIDKNKESKKITKPYPSEVYEQ